VEPIVLCVNRIARGKRLDLAVEAFARLARERMPTARLLVVGGPDGDSGQLELTGARFRANEFGVADRVSFIGPVVHADLPHYYRAADALLLASERESFGLVLLEAQACGLPVVSTSVGGACEVVRNGRTGVVVDQGDVEGLAAGLAYVLDPALAPRLRAQAIGRAASFDWSRTSANLVRLLASLADQRLRRASARCA
jgi:glycosyltransferase involved in cell wall biosynthesis